jgi:hypothetical protein
MMRSRHALGPTMREGQFMKVSRWASVAVALGYLVAALAGIGGGPGNSVLLVAASLLFPLALIWFPDVFGNYTGPVRGGYVDQTTPPAFIAAAGWFFLVGLPLAFYFLGRSCG